MLGTVVSFFFACLLPFKEPTTKPVYDFSFRQHDFVSFRLSKLEFNDYFDEHCIWYQRLFMQIFGLKPMLNFTVLNKIYFLYFWNEKIISIIRRFSHDQFGRKGEWMRNYPLNAMTREVSLHILYVFFITTYICIMECFFKEKLHIYTVYKYLFRWFCIKIFLFNLKKRNG